MLSMPWRYLETWSWQDFYGASPLATAISSVFTVAVVAVLCAFVRWWRGGKRAWFAEWLVTFFRGVDQTLVRCSLATRIPWRWPRRVVTIGIFILVTSGGIKAPWPWCLLVLIFGLLNVFIVFRHWSHEEDEVKNEVSPENKEIKIQGNLSIEMVAACAFVLVYSTTGFAQIQAARRGFDMPPGANPFTFIWYALVEALNVTWLVSYYDHRVAEYLHFNKLGTVAAHSVLANSAVVVFRGEVDLIILAALKRFIDIARRVAEGLDLRPIKEILDDPSAPKGDVDEAVRKLAKFALRGRRAAPEQLEQIITEVRDHIPRFAVDARFAAADALVTYGAGREESGKFLVAIDGYRRIAREDWTRERVPLLWADVQD